MVYPFLPAFSRGLGVDVAALSVILSVRAFVGAFGPFLGSVADSRGRRTGMLLGASLFTLGAALTAIWPTVWAFGLGLILAVLGKSVFDPSVHAYTGDHVPYRNRGTAMAILEVSWSLAFILGIPAMGLLIQHFGWSAPFPTLAFGGLLIILALFRWIPREFDTSASPGSGSALWKNLHSVLTNPAAVAGLVMSFFINTGNEMINLMFGVWIEDKFGLAIAALGAASIVIGLSELGGEGLSGFFTDRLGKGLAITLGLLLNSFAVLLLPVIGRSMSGALVGLFFFYLTFEFTIVSTLPLMAEVNPRARATLLAANSAALSLGRALGALLAVPVYRLGISANAAGSGLFNLFALAALFFLLRRFKLQSVDV